MLNEGDAVVVAIDGPSASGKSTVSRRVADELQCVYVDSGSLYRGMTWKAVQEDIDVTNADAVIAMMERLSWEFFMEGRVVKFRIDGLFPGQDLRSAPVRESVSDVAAIPEIRAFIVDRLREMVSFGSLVMEGRDIGTVVFPDSIYKYYIDADPEERARRRYGDLVQAEGRGDVKEVLDSLRRRDQKDASRKSSPLQIALGAKVLDTTHMSIDEVVVYIIEDLRSMGVEK